MSNIAQPNIPNVAVTMLLRDPKELLCPLGCRSYIRPQDLLDHMNSSHAALLDTTHLSLAAYSQNLPPSEPSVVVTLILCNPATLFCPLGCRSYMRPQNLANHMVLCHRQHICSPWPQNLALDLDSMNPGPGSVGLSQQHEYDETFDFGDFHTPIDPFSHPGLVPIDSASPGGGYMGSSIIQQQPQQSAPQSLYNSPQAETTMYSTTPFPYFDDTGMDEGFEDLVTGTWQDGTVPNYTSASATGGSDGAAFRSPTPGSQYPEIWDDGYPFGS